MDHHPYVFLLGGHDLEMITIKRMLIDNGFEEPGSIADLNLQWGAKLSAYQAWFNDEQTFVGIELTREQQLIAANDKGFIHEMEALGAIPEEITDIRHRDREVRGVTEEDVVIRNVKIE